MSPPAPGRRWGLFAFAGLAAILALTLYPIPSAAGIADQTPLLCLVCGENGGTDVILNLLLFTPFAVGLRLSGWSWARVTLTCAIVSFSVELCQYLWVSGSRREPQRSAHQHDRRVGCRSNSTPSSSRPRAGRARGATPVSLRYDSVDRLLDVHGVALLSVGE